jgi:xanthine dehydrogenase/oxidase
VLYAGQSLGLIVASSQSIAARAAKLVRITYKDHQKPVLTIKEAMKDPERTMIHAAFGPPNVFDAGDVQGSILNHLNF